MAKQKFSIILGIAVILAISGYSAQTLAAQNGQREEKIPGQYIVVFKDNVADADLAAEDMAKKHGLNLTNKYSHVIKGFAATISDAELAEIKNDPRVDFVSEDRVVYADGKPGQTIVQSAQTIPTGIKRIGAASSTNKGAGIGVAVIDTGIDLTHPDLKANIATVNKTCIARTLNANDDNGHGTHVAGTIAAVNNTIGVVGVAPGAKLFAVKVLDKNGSGTWSSVICGIDWVTANAQAYGIKVANMSLGGTGKSDNNCGNTNNDALHKAICRSRDKGVTYVVAAGNESTDAANSVPSSYNDAVITVSALVDTNGQANGGGASTGYGTDDTFASFSNYGSSTVDIGAPGVNIFSTYKGGTYATMSGTSMASPHVAGAAALYLKSNPSAVWTQVRDALMAVGEKLNFGHTDPSGLHSEPILQTGSL